jgi:preprotein translocase subunit SecG
LRRGAGALTDLQGELNSAIKMTWLHTTTIILHVLIASAIVGLVLLQRGKGADAGAGFGAGASGTVFGARGSASFLSRTTATLAVLFIVTSLTLAYLDGRTPVAPSSVLDRVPAQTQAPASESELPAIPSDATSQPIEAPAGTNEPAQN